MSPAAPPGMAKPSARAFAVLAALAAIVAFVAPASARTSSDALPAVALAELPREARDCFHLILRGGPFPYERDGIAFGNRERMLPQKPRGYYREYTVPTPGAHNRGARRIICGGPPRTPDACYYTADHYQSFRRIVE